MPHIQYSNAYTYQCRAAWYEAGCPAPKVAIDLKIFPPDEMGRIVELGSLRHWLTDKDWYIWKDEQDAKLASKIDEELGRRKFLLVKEQLAQDREIRNKSYLHIIENGFDSSAAATSAFFKASESERVLVGIEAVIEKLSEMDTPAIRARMKELAERAEATDVIDVAEVENAESLD